MSQSLQWAVLIILGKVPKRKPTSAQNLLSGMMVPSEVGKLGPHPPSRNQLHQLGQRSTCPATRISELS